MKIILDSKDLKSKLAMMLSSEGIGLSGEPEWRIEDGNPTVILTVTSIPPEMQAKSIGEHLEVFLMDKILTILNSRDAEQVQLLNSLAEKLENKIDNMVSEVLVNATFNEKQTKTPEEERHTTPRVITPKVNRGDRYHTHGLEKQLEAHEMFMNEMNKKIEEEAEEFQNTYYKK